MLCQYVLMLKLYVIVVLTQSFQGSWGGGGGAGSEDKKIWHCYRTVLFYGTCHCLMFVMLIVRGCDGA